MISDPIKNESRGDHGNQLVWKGNATKKPEIRLESFFLKKDNIVPISVVQKTQRTGASIEDHLEHFKKGYR